MDQCLFPPVDNVPYTTATSASRVEKPEQSLPVAREGQRDHIAELVDLGLRGSVDERLGAPPRPRPNIGPGIKILPPPVSFWPRL